MATDLEKYIDRINAARVNKFITSTEATNLRKRARELANRKGDLGPKDRQTLNQLLKEYSNKKGNAAIEQGRLPIGVSPSDPIKPPRGAPPTPPPSTPPTPPAEQQKQTAEDRRWKEFSSNWKKLGENDKNILRTVWPNAGAGSSAEKSFRRKHSTKQKAFIDAVDGGNITRNEKIELFKVFGLDKDGRPVKPPKEEEPEKGPDGQEDTTDADTGDSGTGLGDDAAPEGQTGVGGLIGDEGTDVPTIRGGGKKIKIPSSENDRAFIAVPEDDDTRFSMPNIERKISKEIERITLDLVESTREFIEAGIDFQSIEYIPQREVFTEDELLYYEFPDSNTPPSSDNDIANLRMNALTEALQELIDKGDKSSPRYNYAEYIDIFEYLPQKNIYRFSVEITGAIIEDLTVKVTKVKSRDDSSG